jgi:hypothetical protein
MRLAAVLSIILVSVFLTQGEVLAQERGREFRPGAVRVLEDVPPGRLRERIERLPATARERAVAWLGNLHFTSQDLETMEVDRAGGIYFVDPAPGEVERAPEEPSIAAAAVAVSPFPASLVFHSKPGAPNVLYLNFTGENVTNTEWNTGVGRSSIPAVAFSTDSDLTTFSDAEQLAIRRIWQRVAEDYAAFNVDVTTERPATFTTRTAHAVITRSTDANGADNPAPDSGGVAYVGVFGISSYARYRPAWIYHDNFGGQESYTAEAVSHELGHNLGLTHDGKSDGTEYYGGHGSGETSWGPVMGTGYSRNVSQWSKGDYYNANNTQDDLATIAGKLAYRADDHGNTLGAATPLSLSAAGSIVSTTPENDPRNTNTVNKGILERNTDSDMFSFASGAGTINLSAKPWITAGGLTRGGNVDVVLELYNAAGQLLATNNPATSTTTSIQTNVVEGVYYLAVKGTGVGNPTSSSPTGYTSYGSIGQYFISGSVVPSGVVIPPGAELAITDITDPGVGAKGFSVTYTDDVAIDVASLGNDDIRVTGPNGYDRAATLVAVDLVSNGSPRRATYRIDPPSGPAGTWGEQDDGVYSVMIAADTVRDTQGEAVPAGPLGTFNVAVPRAIYFAMMDTNPGWSMEGLWQFGAPSYPAGAGPVAGFSGGNIVAYNLSGNYENRLSPVYATTGPINCAGASSVTLKFQRWLRLRTGDKASIQVSTNGTEWTDVWTTTGVLDSSWTAVQYSLPSWVAGSSSVRLRWGISAGLSQNDIGWNIDDVVVLGNGVVDTAPPTATLNAATLVTGGSPTHSITVTYSDETAVAVASLGATDLLVIGPNGTNVVEYAGVDTASDGTPRTALYSIAAPTGAWQSADNGEYSVYIQAGEVSDTANNSMDAALLGKFTVAIVTENQPPSVALLAPGSGATFRTTDPITLSASATDDGGIERVEFFADGNLVGTGTIEEGTYSATVILGAGTHSISARAVDSAGASATSSEVTINVEEATIAPPEVVGIEREVGSTTVTLATSSSAPHVLEASSDLQTWIPVATNAPSSGSVTFSHSTAEPRQTYRVRISGP